ncbi:hypothetical protein A2U01_0083998, partial [Trifolium medium]|nr:hypothetical protein [Trifolium medium]
HQNPSKDQHRNHHSSPAAVVLQARVAAVLCADHEAITPQGPETQKTVSDAGCDLIGAAFCLSPCCDANGTCQTGRDPARSGSSCHA